MGDYLERMFKWGVARNRYTYSILVEASAAAGDAEGLDAAWDHFRVRVTLTLHVLSTCDLPGLLCLLVLPQSFRSRCCYYCCNNRRIQRAVAFQCHLYSPRHHRIPMPRCLRAGGALVTDLPSGQDAVPPAHRSLVYFLHSVCVLPVRCFSPPLCLHLGRFCGCALQ
jgi:hypothetical protein